MNIYRVWTRIIITVHTYKKILKDDWIIGLPRDENLPRRGGAASVVAEKLFIGYACYAMTVYRCVQCTFSRVCTR